MDAGNEMLDIIAKIMNEEGDNSNPCMREYFKLKTLLTDELVECLDEGYYNDNATIVSEINNICEEIEFFEGVNDLLGKTIVNVVSLPEDLRMLFKDKSFISEEFDANEYIPTFVLGNEGKKEEKIYVINFANKKIEISCDELNLILNNVWDATIEVRKLIKVFLVKTNAITSNLCICIWPDKILDDIGYQSYLFDRSSGNFVIADSGYKIKKRMLALKDQAAYVICNSKEGEEIQKALTERQLQRVKHFVSTDEAKEMFEKNVFSVGAYCVDNAIENVLLDVESFYRKTIVELKESERLLTEDLVYLNEGSVKKNVKSNNVLIQEKRKLFEKALESYENVCARILNQARAFQTVREREEHLDEGDIQLWDSTVSDIFFKLVNMNEYKRANECIEIMKRRGYKYCVFFELYLNFCENKKLDFISIDNIKSCDEESEELSRIKIALSDILKCSDRELASLAEWIDVPHTGLEYYACAMKEMHDKNYAEAAEWFKCAWYQQVDQAGEKLLNLVFNHPECDVRLSELVNMMIPDANYLEGIDKYDEDRKHALVNLKIAAALKQFDAMEIMADCLYDSCKGIAWEEARKDENREHISDIIHLYETLYEIQPEEKYKEHIGLMYCKLGDFKRAMNILQNVETPEAYYECALMYEHGDGVVMDLDKARTYYRKCGNFKDASVQALKISEQIRNKEEYKKNSNYYSKNGYGEQREVVSVEKSGLCFITTAACLALNESKNCNQLNVLRRFRDEYISDGGIGDKLISEYYRIGPSIVRKIDREWNPIAVYSQLWEYYILPSCYEIENHNWEKAKNIYITMVKRLCEKYKILVDSNIMKIYNIKL